MTKKEIKKRLSEVALTAVNLLVIWGIWQLCVLAWHLPYDKGLEDGKMKCEGQVEMLYNDIYTSGLRDGYDFSQNGKKPTGVKIIDADTHGDWIGLTRKDIMRRIEGKR